jgi:hypothetical protein
MESPIRPIEIRPIRTAPGRGSYNRWDDNSGFRPGDVAAGVVGGAVGTAATTAPIGGEAYARRNGFVCIPGTWFRGISASRGCANRIGKRRMERPVFPCGSDESGS